MKRLLSICLLFLGLPVPLGAIPAYARLTGNSCSYCHASPTLQLTAEGIKFERNGMRQAPLKFGKEEQSLEYYASIVLEHEIDAFRTKPQTTPSVQVAQPVWSIVGGGALSEHFSFKAIYHLNASDAATENLEEGYVQYNAAPWQGAVVAIRGGQFNPQILRTFGLGTASYVEGPLVLNNTVSDATPFTLSTAMRGIDANLYWGALEASAGVFDATSGTYASNPTNHKDTYADVFWTLDSHASGAGLFRYDGKNLVFTSPGDPTTPLLYSDSFYRNGLLLRFAREKWRLTGAVFQGAHTTDALGTRTRNLGWYGLAEAGLNDYFGAFARYDLLRPDTNDHSGDTKMAVLGLNGFLFKTPRTGGRWVLETSQTTNGGIRNYQTLLYLVVAY
jgi:hypothetical protein